MIGGRDGRRLARETGAARPGLCGRRASIARHTISWIRWMVSRLVASVLVQASACSGRRSHASASGERVRRVALHTMADSRGRSRDGILYSFLLHDLRSGCRTAGPRGPVVRGLGMVVEWRRWGRSISQRCAPREASGCSAGRSGLSVRLGGPMDGLVLDRYAAGGARASHSPSAFLTESSVWEGARGGVRRACDPNPNSLRTHVLQPWRERARDARSRCARRLRV
jgi:hypothetical protein